MELLNSPIVMIAGAIVLGVIILSVVFIFVMPKRKKGVLTILFDRNNSFRIIKCDQIAGIASYVTGGFDINENAVMRYSFGKSIWEFGKPQNRRASRPIFLSRVGDTSPIRFKEDKNKKDTKIISMSRTEFDRRESLAAEIARSEAATKMSSVDLLNVGLIGVIALLAIPLLIMGMRLALK